jgi:hypothetical protein
MMRINAASVAWLGLLALAVAAQAGGNNCGLCPASTSATWWEYDFSYNSYYSTYAEATTSCGTDLQVGGACEAYCYFADYYDNTYEEGYFSASHELVSGWGAEGANAGTFCAIANDYYFNYDEYYYFYCDVYAWKLCCRAPGFWDGYYIGSSPQPRTSAGGAGHAPTRPGAGKPLSAKVVARVIEAKEKGNIHAGQPAPRNPTRRGTPPRGRGLGPQA